MWVSSALDCALDCSEPRLSIEGNPPVKVAGRGSIFIKSASKSGYLTPILAAGGAGQIFSLNYYWGQRHDRRSRTMCGAAAVAGCSAPGRA
ncbi:hypothetical protein COCSUDRAFT_60015 [Coccomyxa subellipsoidea C-169]|uniref:Uncharacterized protein n=1 Tax=Coccomyxa subellipsoidea (strain C-169) TaxID=574566 RepID=I0YJY7_COCSC|nr:hypothetical protein COCSUDRAFT_60015 [Coccomyxa subellipsoidea C-169]EIE18706.1 hypothetical protein COCSUDRAFT_60015 [Coccomyxa subellipsoidea C-169]|eukprot:XP_005643250.1 hypothetical protein COCSUDRAFT_60015 [Coccomyxa subellipsoidea C-169]